MPLYIAKSGDLEGCHACLTDSQRKDRATQLLIKYKSGALVTQILTKPQSRSLASNYLQNLTYLQPQDDKNCVNVKVKMNFAEAVTNILMMELATDFDLMWKTVGSSDRGIP